MPSARRLDLSHFVNEIEMCLSAADPNFGAARFALQRAEEEWSDFVGLTHDMLSASIGQTEISPRLVDLLEERMGVVYVRDLVGLTREDLLECDGIDTGYLNEIRSSLGKAFCRSHNIGNPRPKG